MSRISNSFSITVSSGGSSYLSQQAALMVAGEWRQLTNPANQATVITGQSGVSGSITLYANKMQWNTKNQCIEYVGADHGQFTSMNYVRYSAANHSWTGLSGTGVNGSDSGTGPGHNFDQYCINPNTGDGYYRVYGGTVEVVRTTLNGSTFSHLFTASGTVNINMAVCWWTGAFTGIFHNGSFSAGAQGLLMMYAAIPDGEVYAYDPLSTRVDFMYGGDGHPAAPGAFDSYQQVMAYSAIKNCAVYGGNAGTSGANDRQLWKLSADGSVTTLPLIPSGTNRLIGVQRGQLICDPVTGDFLILTAGPSGELWVMNPTTNTWSQKTNFTINRTQVGGGSSSSSTPPNGLAVDNFNSQAAGDGTVWCDIPEYGVIALLVEHPSASPGFNHSFWLYKHA